MSLITIEGLHVSIGETLICADLHLTLQPGDRLAILGRNGSGKTTLLHTLAGLRPITHGKILLKGDDLTTLPARHRARQMGLLLQDQVSVFPGTVQEYALLGRHPHLARWQQESADDLARADAALACVGLTALAQRNITSLSGGERQRLAFATLLCQDPDILLLDEPSNHLDLHHQIALLTSLARLAEEQNKGIIMILHDINLAIRFCNRFLLLFGDGMTQQGDAASTLTEANLSTLYQHPIQTLNHAGSTLFVPA